jgi:hypothetical protein
MGQFKKRKVSEYPSLEVPLMDDDLEKVFNRTKEQSYELLKSLDRNEFDITSLQVPNPPQSLLRPPPSASLSTPYYRVQTR